MWTADHPALVAAARFGIAPDHGVTRIDDDDVVVLRDLARRDRLSGLMVAGIDAGSIAVSEDGRAGLVEDWRESLVGCTIVEALVVRVAAVFAAAGVEWRLTKGAAVAHLDYPDLSWRSFGDADVVVHPAHWMRATASLDAAGYRRQFVQTSDRYTARFGKGVTFETPTALEVDLHRRFADGLFGVRSRMTDVFGDPPDTIELAGVRIPVLSRPWRLVHACYHAVLGGFSQLRAVRDVAQLVANGADLDQAVTLVRPWRGAAVVAEAAVQTRLRLGLDLPGLQPPDGVTTSRIERRVLDVFIAEAPYRTQALTALAGLAPWDAAAFAWSSVRRRARSRRSDR